MVSSLVLTILVGYIVLVAVYAKQVTTQAELGMYENLHQAHGVFQKLGSQKDELDRKKGALKSEALEIFTLYEITKEITKSLNEKEAFEIFKKKLHEHVTFKQCLFLDPISNEVKHLRKSDDYFIFTLQSKRMKIGFLAIEKMLEEDKEKVMILGHQFALALRRVRLHQEIEQIAITDSLTEVHTRRHTMERLKEELKRSRVRNISMPTDQQRRHRPDA